MPLYAALGERDGIDYHFITLEAFNALRSQDLFKEDGEYKSHRYGTLKPSASSFTEIYNASAANGVKLNGNVRLARGSRALLSHHFSYL